MPATKKARLEHSAAGVRSIASYVGSRRPEVRKPTIEDPTFHADYDKWNTWVPADIPEPCRTNKPGAKKAHVDNLKDFLSLQGLVRGFQAHQNWPQDKKKWVWKKFDELTTEDRECKKTWFALTFEAAAAYDAHLKERAEEAQRASAAVAAEAARLAEEARERAHSDASQDPLTLVRAGESSTTNPDLLPFTVIPDQAMPLLHPDDAYLHEMSRIVMLEAAKQEAEEQRDLLAALEGRGIRRRKEAGRAWDRSDFSGDAPYPALRHYELYRFVEEKQGSAQDQPPTLWAFPTPFERSLVPPDVLCGPHKRTLDEQLAANYWLQPTSTGLVCRACFGRRKSERKLTFVTHVLPWEGLKNLNRKITDHLRAGKQSVARHQQFHIAFTESFTRLYRFPAPATNNTKEDVVASLLNTQHLVRLFQVMATTLASAKAISESNLICHLLSLLDSSTRSFLQKPYNLTSATIRNQLVDILYFRVKERVARKVKGSQFLCLLADEAQDTSKTSHISVVLKVFNHGRPEEVFWDIHAIQGQHTGERMARVVCEMMRPLNCWGSVCALGTDGASSMSGEYRGARMFWQKYCCPFAVWVWCLAHQLNLCCVEAAKTIDQVNAGFSVVQRVFLLFRTGHGSTQRMDVFDECRKMVAAVDTFFFYRTDLALVDVGDTRWLSHERAAKTVTASLKVCLLAIEKLAANSHADALVLKRDFSINACFSLFLLAEVCPILSCFSRLLQRPDLCWLEASTFKLDTVRKLEKLRDDAPSFPVYFNCYVVIADSKPNPTWWGIDPSQELFMHFHDRFARPYINALIQAFADRLVSLEILEGLGSYDPRAPTFKELFSGIDVSQGDPSDVARRIEGRPELDVMKQKMAPLLDHFCSEKPKYVSPDVEAGPHINAQLFPGDKRSEALQELPRVLVEMARIQIQGAPTFTDYASRFLQLHKQGKLSSLYPTTVLFLRLALILPLGTTSVERTFSVLRMLHHYLRNATHDKTFRKLLFLACNLDKEIGDDLMRDLVHDFCLSTLSHESTFDTTEDDQPSDEEENDTDLVEEAPANLSEYLFESKRKLRFAHFELWKEARNIVQGWERAFRENPELFQAPRAAAIG